MAWFQLILAAIFIVLSFVLAPKPKKQKGPEFDQPEAPTSEAGRPIPVLYGCMEITGVNVVAVPDKQITTVKIKA